MATLSSLTNTTSLSGTDEFYVLDGANSRAITWSAFLDQLEAQGAAPSTFISSGTFADARISSSSVTQHLGAYTTNTGTQTLTNKTIDGDSNTISNLDLGNEVDWAAATDIADRTAFASGDKLAIFEAGVGLRKIDYDDLPGAGGGLSNIVEDTTPQLGGDLDINTNSIVSTSNGNITLTPNGTGNVVLGNFTFDADQTVGAGQDNYVFTYDNGTGLISLEAATGGSGDSWGDAVDANIVPDADGTRNIGSTGTRFATTYSDNMVVTTSVTVAGSEVITEGNIDTLTDTAVVGADEVPFGDTSDTGNAKKRSFTNVISDLSIQVEPSEGGFANGDKTKLDGIEASADVTDATNVAAAGAVMDGDFSSNGLMRRTGAGTYTVATAPSGTIVGTTDTQTLTNKTLTTPDITDPTIAHEYNAQTGTTYTLVAADQSAVVTMNNASANTLTIPTNASVAFPVGTKVEVWMLGAGTTTIAGDTGVTLQGNGGSASAGSCDIQTQYGGASLTKIATNTWMVGGDIDAVA